MNISPPKTHPDQAIPVLDSMEPKPVVQPVPETYRGNVAASARQDSHIQPVRRLIVLVPNADLDEVHFARDLWEKAFAPGLSVVLLSLCSNDTEEPLIQRRLINMGALIRHPRVPVETHIAFSRDWLRTIKPMLEQGDVIICHEEQSVGWGHQQLVSKLMTLPAPVWTFSGFYRPKPAARPRWQTRAIFWAGTIAILAGSFYLQIQIDTTDNLAKDAILILSVLAELGLLYIWNSIFDSI